MKVVQGSMKKRYILGPYDSEFLKGGDGSGHHGHVGRAGSRGGSGDHIATVDQKFLALTSDAKVKMPDFKVNPDKIYGQAKVGYVVQLDNISSLNGARTYKLSAPDGTDVQRMNHEALMRMYRDFISPAMPGFPL